MLSPVLNAYGMTEAAEWGLQSVNLPPVAEAAGLGVAGTATDPTSFASEAAKASPSASCLSWRLGPSAAHALCH